MLVGNSPPQKLKTPFSHSQRKFHLYERGQEIPLVERGIWQVNRGVVQLFQLNPQGKETLLGWGMENSFFGHWLTDLETLQVKAMSDVYLQWYSVSEIDQNPLLAQTILMQLRSRIQQTEKLLTIVGLKTVENRLVELLMLLSQYLGQEKDSSIRIRVRFTHQNLADAINTTRVTVTRLLGELQKKGFITLDNDRHINILSQHLIR